MAVLLVGRELDCLMVTLLVKKKVKGIDGGAPGWKRLPAAVPAGRIVAVDYSLLIAKLHVLFRQETLKSDSPFPIL